MPNFIDITGQRFGRLTAIHPAGMQQNGRWRLMTWLCQCDCGRLRVVNGHNLRCGRTASCGCTKKGTGNPNYRHGYAHKGKVHPLYRVWAAMLQRCYNPNAVDFRLYGARGIVVCERWHEFANFIDDVGERPQGTSIDRIDNEGMYAPNKLSLGHTKRAASKPAS